MKTLPFILLSLLLALAEVTSATAAVRLRVGTYNVGHFNQGLLTDGIGGYQNPDVAAASQRWKTWLDNQKLDILGVQEWNQFFDKGKTLNAETTLLEPFFSNRVFGPPRSTAYPIIYNGIATSLPLTRSTPDIVELALANYYGVIGEIDLGGEKITVISFHNPFQRPTDEDDSTPDYRDEGFELLKAELQKHTNFIALGDTNYSNNEKQQSLQALGFNIANGLGGVFLRTTKGGSRIDQIITSSNILIESVSAPQTGLNDDDHYPVLATIVLPDNLAPAPTVTTQPPVEQTTVAGRAVTLFVSSTGMFPTTGYRWQFSSNNGSSWTDIPAASATYTGASTDTLVIVRPTAAMSGWQYRCIVSNDYNSGPSAASTLSVNPAALNLPTSIAADNAGDLYVSDAGNHAIYRLLPSGTIQLLAGGTRSAGYNDGDATEARFRAPAGLAVSSGTLYVADSGNNALRAINQAGRVSTVVPATAGLVAPEGVAAASDGTLYIADTGNHVIRSYKNGTLETIAGELGVVTDDFDSPARIVVADSDNRLYIADTGASTGNTAIRALDLSSGEVSTLFSTGGGAPRAPVSEISVAQSAFTGLVVSGTGEDAVVYGVDAGSSVLFQIGASDGEPTVLAGDFYADGLKDGTAEAARFSNPKGLTLGADGSLYVADTGNATIRKVTFDEEDAAVVTTVKYTVGTPSAPPPPAPPPLVPLPPESTGSGGGGGAPSAFFLAALAAAVALRLTRKTS